MASARVEIKNSENKLKPEMFASGSVTNSVSTTSSNDIVIPKSAVMWTGERSVVYIKSVVSNRVNFKLREVTLGASLGDAYIIKEGLFEGEEIVVNGTFTVDAASQLAGKPSMMSPGGGKPISGHDHGNVEMSSENIDSTHKTTPELLTISQEAKDALKPIFTEYLSMKDALTNDNLEDTKKEGTNILKTVEGLNMALFTGDSYGVWMSFSSDLKNALQHVQHFKTLDEIRNAFYKVSNIMIALETTFDPNDEVLYILHCPMANNNSGADWLSKSKEVKNPYYGQSMLTCGKVTKEIK